MALMANYRSPGDRLAKLSECIDKVAKLRDRAAFEHLFDHYAPLIRAYSLAREPGADLVADELVQEVMTRVWLKADKYNIRLANLNTWIFTLARNCRIDYLRRNSRYLTEIDPTDIFNDIEDEGPGPFQLVQQNRAEENIRSELKKLPSSRKY
jgi:RNA polymerase sigma factor (sigma-70 family)